MPPKNKKGKKGKGKKKQIDEEDVGHKLISLEDVMKQDARFNNRIEAIREANDKFQAIIKTRKDYERQNEVMEEWLTYLKCDGLPKPSEPTEIREFLSKWEYFDKLDGKGRHSWLLRVDERSILTQDIDAPNLTKRFLRTQKKDFSLMYKNHIERILTVLAELRDILESSKIESTSIYKDLLELKDIMLRTVQGVLDKFTYRVARHAKAYMEQLDSQTYDFNYVCDIFQMHIWAFKDVPISFTVSLMPKKEIDLHALKVNMTLPFAVLRSNLMLRGLHMIYDHYSEFSKTFEIPDIPLEENFGILLIKEWEKRKQLQKEIKDNMIKERAEYDEWINKKNEEAKNKEAEAKRKDQNKGSKAKGKEKKKKKGKKEKILKEPPIITDNTFPDVEDEFHDFDTDQYENYLKGINPEVFDLEEGEINLREYTLLGGLYEFNFVQKPKHTLFPGLILKWIQQPELLKYKNKNCNIKSVDFANLIDRPDKTHTNRQRGGADEENEDETIENPETDMKKKDSNLELSSDMLFDDEEPALTFFIITFKIPKEICRWNRPVPCQWYDVQEITEDNNNTATVKYVATKEYEMKIPVIINDFIMSSEMEPPMLYNIVNHLVPRITSNHQFSEQEPVTKGLRRTFSKKFLQEFKNDEESESKITTKTPAERLFPTFQTVKPVVIVPIEEEESLNMKDELNKTVKKFSGYLLELEEVKKSKFPIFKESEIIPVEEEMVDSVESRSGIKAVSSGTSRKSVRSVKPKKKKKKKDDEEMSVKDAKKMKKGAFKTVADLLRVMNVFKQNLLKRKAPQEAEQEEEDDKTPTSSYHTSPDESINEKIECLDSDYKHPKWSTKNIFKTEFDEENLEIKLWTHRLGVFAFAFERYTHLPFTEWHMIPDPENWRIIKFYAESKYIKFNIDITEAGYTIEILDFKMAKGRPIVLYEVKEPIPDLVSLKKELQQYDMNIFPEKDAASYVENASEKHLSLELHTYGCMAIYCTFMKFYKSNWNRVTNRRIMIMKCGSVEEETADLLRVKITPEECMFVQITELCTDLNKVVLHYEPRQNLKYTPDLLSLIKSVYYRTIKNLNEEQFENSMLMYNVMTFLQAVRPLSFSW